MLDAKITCGQNVSEGLQSKRTFIDILLLMCWIKNYIMYYNEQRPYQRIGNGYGSSKVYIISKDV